MRREQNRFFKTSVHTHTQLSTCTRGGYPSIQPEVFPDALRPWANHLSFRRKVGWGENCRNGHWHHQKLKHTSFFIYRNPLVVCMSSGEQVFSLPHFQVLSTWRTFGTERRVTKRYHEKITLVKSGWHLLQTGINWKPPGMVQTFNELFFWWVLDKNNHALSSVDKVLLKLKCLP